MKFAYECLRQAQSSGNMDKMMAMIDRCLSEYDQNGWTVPHLHNNADINMLDELLNSQREVIMQLE